MFRHMRHFSQSSREDSRFIIIAGAAPNLGAGQIGPAARGRAYDIEMLIHELTRTECTDILGRSSIGRLACSHFDQPYIVPISYSFDAEEDCVYGFSTVGQKILWMRENPKVCLAV